MKTIWKLVTATLLVLLWLGNVANLFAQATERPFITKWQGVKGAELRIPIIGREYKLVIKDAKGDVVKNEEKLTCGDSKHPYVFTPTEDGVYTVEAGPEGVTNIKMDGEYKGYEWTPVGSCGSLLEVVQFGTVKWITMENAFFGCRLMNFAEGIDVPDLSQVTSMLQMFSGCTSFNSPLKWDVSKVTNMSYMFDGCVSFNQPLKWDVSEVIEMGSMFSGCISFNSPLEWKMKKVNSIWGMFFGCTAFNQPLDTWDVSGVTNMLYLFMNCRSFNQPLENWDVSNVTNMSGMFSGCTSFNQPLGKWKIQTGIGGLGETAMSPTNYSNSLVGWAAQSDLPNEVKFGKDVAGLVYNDAGKAAREKLVNKMWIFEKDVHQASGVSITPRELRLAVGKEWVLPLEKWGVDATEKVTFICSEEGVLLSELTADEKGVRIKGLKNGKCKLTATIVAKEGVHDEYTSACEVEVYVAVESISLAPATKRLQVEEKASLTPTILPAEATEKNVLWSSSDASIAVVNNSGEVTAKRVGRCIIFARTTEEGSMVEAKCEVTVVEKGSTVSVTSITVTPETKTLKVEDTETLKAAVAPDDATVKEVAWSSSDENVATVSEAGLVTAKGVGECTITAKSKEEGSMVKGECKITVKAKTPSAVKDTSLASIIVSPNPFENQLRITNCELRGEYALLSAQGVVVCSGNFDGSEVTVETSELPSGLYLLRLTAENGATKTITVVKDR